MLNGHFDKYPAQKRVAQKIIEHGLRVFEGSVYCGDIELSDSALASATKTNRRTILATISTIEGTRELKKVFLNLVPTCSFKNVAPLMKWGVIEIVPDDVSRPGIIAEVTGIIAKEGISLRQVIADDPDIMGNPRAFIVTERPIPSRLLPNIKAVKGIQGVIIY